MKINTVRLRALLGWLAILLPWIVLVLSMMFGYGFPDSISATYYFEPCITPFMIILGAASILLICYNGYDRQDDIICTLAGIFGLCICLFSCMATPDPIVGTFQLPKILSGWIHNITAILFFGLLAYNSIFLFTKGDANPTKNKKKRNVIFRICGIGMIASFLLLPIFYTFNIHGGTWIVETIALAFFGISWLTKSDIYPWLFCDTPYVD